jgi:putative NADH-flavin reductase
MKIAVIGATGNTGRTFVEQALARGHFVTVLVRSPQKMTLSDPRLTVIQGNVLDPDAVARTIVGQDAIFIALGTGKVPKKSSIRADGTQQIVDVLKASGEKPLVVALSSLGMRDSQKQMPFYWRWPLNRMLGRAFADHGQQEMILRASELPYTVLRPTFMSDKPGTGQAQATASPALVKVAPSIARADVVAYALQTIEEHRDESRAVVLTARPPLASEKARPKSSRLERAR